MDSEERRKETHEYVFVQKEREKSELDSFRGKLKYFSPTLFGETKYYITFDKPLAINGFEQKGKLLDGFFNEKKPKLLKNFEEESTRRLDVISMCTQ